MEKVILDSKFIDAKIEEGKIVVEFSLIEVLKDLAGKSDNKIDDALVELVEKALKT